MASYTVTGHPLNYADIGVSEANLPAVRAALQNNGVGKTVTLTLTGPDDTKVKGHACLS
jgi:hypothetical protein